MPGAVCKYMRVPMEMHTSCVFTLWNPHESLGALECFSYPHEIFRGAHADPIESHTQAVYTHIGTGMNFWNKRFMHVPMKLHMNCVCTLWNLHESLAALECFREITRGASLPTGRQRA